MKPRFLEARIRTEPSASYTLRQSDHGSVIDFTQACSVTVPHGLSLPFVAGLSQGGSGQVTVVAGSGVTVNEPDSQLKSETQFVMLQIVAFAANVYRLYGRTAA